MSQGKLIEAVDAGTATAYDFGLLFPLATNFEHTNAWDAYRGSLDAAKRLHDALLPGWDWTMHGNGQAALWPPGTIEEQNAGCIEVDVEGWPSRALLLAILRALEQEGR